MTRSEAIEATREALLAAEELAGHLRRLWSRMEARFPLAEAENKEDDGVERVHALLRMFEQLYDLVGRRLFRGAMILVEEDAARLSAKALVLRLEQLGAIKSRAEWLALTEVRNILVHEYSLSAATFASQANLAGRHINLLLATLAQITRFLQSEGLMP